MVPTSFGAIEIVQKQRKDDNWLYYMDEFCDEIEIYIESLFIYRKKFWTMRISLNNIFLMLPRCVFVCRLGVVLKIL